MKSTRWPFSEGISALYPLLFIGLSNNGVGLCDKEEGRERDVWRAAPWKGRLWQRLYQGSMLSCRESFEHMVLLHWPPFDHCRSTTPPLLWHPVLQVHLAKESQTATKRPHKTPMSRQWQDAGDMWVSPALGSTALTIWDTTGLSWAVQQQSWGVLGMGTSEFGTSGTFIYHIPDVRATHTHRARKPLTQQTCRLNTMDTHTVSFPHWRTEASFTFPHLIMFYMVHKIILFLLYLPQLWQPLNP